MKKEKLLVNSSCKDCSKNCPWRGLTVSEASVNSKYKCNTSKGSILTSKEDEVLNN